MTGPTEPPAPAAVAANARDVLDTPHAGPATIRGGILRTSGYIAGVSLTVVSAALLIRHLGVADFGRYVTVASLIATVSGVTEAGLTTIGLREYAAREGAERDRLMSSLQGIRIVLTSLGVLVAAAFAIAVGYSTTMVLGTLLAGAGLLLTVTQATFSVPLSVRLKLGTVAALDLLRQAATAIAIVALVIAGASLLPFLAVPLPVGAFVLVVTVVLVRHDIPLRPRFRGEWRPLLRSVLPFSVAVAIGALYFRMTVIVMSIVASPIQTGYYSTSYRVLEVLIVVPSFVVGSAFPLLARAARDDRDRLRYALERLAEASLILGTWISLCLVVGAPFIIAVLAGDTSDPSIAVLRIQAPALIATFLATCWLLGLLSLVRHRVLLINSVISITVTLALTLVLVPVLAAQGAAIAVTVGEVLGATLSYLALRRVRPDMRFPVRVGWRVAVAAGLGVACLAIPGVPSVVLVAISSAVYFAVLLALRAIPEELWIALRQWRDGGPQASAAS